MGAPLSPLWPGGPRGGGENGRLGREGKKKRWEGGRERERERVRGGGGEGGGGSLASSLICKKCITSEIKRKITAPKQNTQSRREGEGWSGREGGGEDSG